MENIKKAARLGCRSLRADNGRGQSRFIKCCLNAGRGAILGGFGGCVYGAVEIAFRGKTHISMVITGGLCFLLIVLVGRRLTLPLRMAVGAVIITVLELICGVIVNIWLNLDVWDYSTRALNILGQICPLFTGIWYFLSLPAIFLGEYFCVKALGIDFPTRLSLNIAARRRRAFRGLRE